MFAAVVGENNRLAELNDITDKYREIMRAVRGEMDALVTVAQVRSKPPYKQQRPLPTTVVPAY
jgi:F0F1-type ATP synthase delta subunit